VCQKRVAEQNHAARRPFKESLNQHPLPWVGRDDPGLRNASPLVRKSAVPQPRSMIGELVLRSRCIKTKSSHDVPASIPIYRRRAVFGADQVQSHKPEPVIPSKLAIPVVEPEDIWVSQLFSVGTVKSGIQAVQQ
jgi:hypothetical protein